MIDFNKKLYIFGKEPIFGDLKSDDTRAGPIHGIAAVIGLLKETGELFSFTQLTTLYKQFSSQGKHSIARINDLIDCGILARRGARGKIKLGDSDAADLLYLPVLQQPAVREIYKDYLKTLDMSILNVGTFNVPAKTKYKDGSAVKSMLIIERSKFPETYKDLLSVLNGKYAYVDHKLINFDCLVTYEEHNELKTELRNYNIWDIANSLRRRLISTDAFLWNARYCTDPEHQETWMDIIVPK